ncbi:hypothetical protein [uncultured Demequina sp.]|uniref:hypothetical protein n=1 Tax=uncultured Demequina sp. TaxID=693499 RepID=UPI0025D70B52|nr:hypothetical protein [uncultured Demequina sp.]
MKTGHGALVAATLLVLSACSTSEPSASPEGSADPAGQRLDQIEAAVAAWAGAESLEAAHAAAEEARNLVVGPAGPFYGDADGDGELAGDVAEGLLPGLDGETGLAQSEPVSACVEADVLGGSWEDPGERWDVALAAYDAWTPSNNTMPTLPSHPQRVVGWATFTLGTDDLDEAREYAGHAQIHVRVSRAAIEDCGS